MSINGNATEIIQEYNANHSDMLQFSYLPEDENYGDTYTEVDNAIYDVEINRPSVEDLFPRIDDFIINGLYEMINNANSKIDNKIPSLIFKNKISDNAYFINFNYTMLLERLYKINSRKIFHIHGTENPIIGNEINLINFLDENDIDIGYSNYEIDNIESSSYFSEDEPSNAQNFRDSVKFSDEEIEEHNKKLTYIVNEISDEFIKTIQDEELLEFISKINENDIYNIIVIGHSMGLVDIPYFETINKKIKKMDYFLL